MMKFFHFFRRGQGRSSSSNDAQRNVGASSHIGTSSNNGINTQPQFEQAVAASSSTCLDTNQETLDISGCRNMASPAEVDDTQSLSDVEIINLREELKILAEDKAKLISELQSFEKTKLELSNLQAKNDELQQRCVAMTNFPSDIENESMPMQEVNLNLPEWEDDPSRGMTDNLVTLAGLQDQLVQMEESHLTLNEELQATIQELADAQTQITELLNLNERLGEEKGVLLDSLVRQTEKLEDARSKTDTLQGLLLDNPGTVGTTEREQKLVELLKIAQEDKTSLMIKQEETLLELNNLRRTSENMLLEKNRLTERVELLEVSIDATHEERKQLDLELAQTKEECSSRSIEISRLNTLLENARAKINEYEEARKNVPDKSELDELLDNARREIDVLESQSAALNDQLLRSLSETDKLKSKQAALQEEVVVLRNSARSAVSDLERECEQRRVERDKLLQKYDNVYASYSELQNQVQCHINDKRQLENVLTETQQHLGECEAALVETKKELSEERLLRTTETVEMELFKTDLLLTVRVANDFKNEAQEKVDKISLENKNLKDKIKTLDAQVSNLQMTVKQFSPPMQTTPVSSEDSRIKKIVNQDCRLSVKSLIESIENATKQGKTGLSSSLPSTVPSTPVCDYVFEPPLPLRDQQQVLNKQKLIWTDDSFKTSKTSSEETAPAGTNVLASRSLEIIQKNTSDLCNGERKDPLARLAKNGGSKRNALLKWCQNRTMGYSNIDITNFGSSWNDGLAFCAMLHSYLPERVPFDTLTPNEKRRNFTIAFSAAESVGILTTLNTEDMIQEERPNWKLVMAYVTAIYKHFET